MVKNLLLVALGGGIGSMLRYLTSVIVVKQWPYNYPLATFIVNMIGCLLIGLLIGLSEKEGLIDKELRLLLITGFCGGFTTFSTFSAENLQLLESGHYASLLFYVLSSVVIGIAAVWVGVVLAR